VSIESIQEYIEEGKRFYEGERDRLEREPESRDIVVGNIKHRLSMWNNPSLITDLEMELGDCVEDYVSDVQTLLYLLGEK
jgi:hypothetical protein